MKPRPALPGMMLVLFLFGSSYARQHEHSSRMTEGPDSGRDSMQALSPYAGQEQRTLKAFSDAEIKGYESGEGMGLARVAELNGYPGPRHALDLDSSLRLAPKIRERIEDLYNTMHVEAVRLGKLILTREKGLDELFTKKTITAKELTRALADIGLLQSKLREAHLQAHLATAVLLTPEQLRTYRQQRGYDNKPEHIHHHEKR